jgi:WD40 repeat protein
MSIREESAMRTLQTYLPGPVHVAYSSSGGQLLSLVVDLLHDKLYYQVWNLASGEELRLNRIDSRAEDLRRCLFEPNGPAFLRAHGYWRAGDEWPLEGPPRLEHLDVLRGRHSEAGWLGFGPGGRRYLRTLPRSTAREQPVVELLKIKGRTVRDFDMTGVTEEVRAAAFSADGKLLALLIGDNEVRLFDTAKGTCSALIGYHRERASLVRFSPAAAILAVATGSTVSLSEGPRGHFRAKLPAFEEGTRALAFSPDGRLLAAGSRDGRVRIYEVDSGREVIDLALGKDAINDLAFAPDAMTAAAACHDRAIVIWDMDV